MSNVSGASGPGMLTTSVDKYSVVRGLVLGDNEKNFLRLKYCLEAGGAVSIDIGFYYTSRDAICKFINFFYEKFLLLCGRFGRSSMKLAGV